MSQSSATAQNPDTRLLHTLANLGIQLESPTTASVADKLAGLIDLSDSITLADALRALTRSRFKPPADALETDASALFWEARGSILTFIADSFRSDAGSVPFLLPRASRQTVADLAEGYQPYQRFYMLHQSEMDHRILKLRNSLRQCLSAHSPDMAKLSALDRIVAEPLLDHSRRLLATVPRTLSRRFKQLAEHYLESQTSGEFGEPDNWLGPHGWLRHFYNEMQDLLLAELDFRLLPVLGLLEALDAEETQTP
ncbi:Protein of unknown function (DUF3348) [Spongiibacter sp. IMCC21906]|uniref:DUF3348 family protein n=1 Tax=Spongiibacter sp. IMCC21906 TaxID=1620392 RepID=UPI00062DFF1E|nr:DUF3348 family protein [Spongiibacter sp. IMCC21906]AKH70696.1 Protein of unknown function (DUF3348) [Spongiibacter sp. IMCC21906]